MRQTTLTVKHSSAYTDTMPDQALLRACRGGDEQAWRHLLTKYERLVYSIPRNYGLSAEDAADITQIVFAALIRSLESLHDDSNLGAWLAQVARRHTWRLLQRRRREETDALDEQMIETLLPARAGQIERWEMIEWLHGGMALLGERCRELLAALYFDPESPSYGEIASRLNMAVGSIGATRARCLQRLQEILSREN